MHKTIRRLVTVAITIALLYVIIVSMLVLAARVSLPTSETLAQWYLGEVINGTSTELRTPYLWCSDFFLGRDRERYAGAEVRNMGVTETPGTGSRETIRFLEVSFEYRMPDKANWEHGQIVWLTTDFQPLQGRRLTCG